MLVEVNNTFGDGEIIWGWNLIQELQNEFQNLDAATWLVYDDRVKVKDITNLITETSLLNHTHADV